MNKRTKLFCLFFMVIAAILFIPMTGQAADDDIVVILDPGHGGGAPGAINGGIREADVNWKIANYVKEILDQTPGITGILSRQENTNPGLDERGILAKENNADLLVSFHINSAETIFNRTMGAETYITGDTKQDRFYKNSSILAKDILSNLRSIGIPSNRMEPVLRFSTDGELYGDGVLSDYYGIIRNPMYYGIPGILIEHCYINSAQDRGFIDSDEDLRRIAEQDAAAIIKNKELFRTNPSGNSLASAIQTIQMSTNADGHPYLYGEVLVNNWLNGMPSAPGVTPKVTLKSTDGTVSYDLWVVPSHDNIYYFDTLLDTIDSSKSYYFEISSQEKYCIPNYHTHTIEIPNQTLGKVNGKDVKFENNHLTLRGTNYDGALSNEITTLSLNQNENGNYYLKGEITVTEWLDGITWSVPKTTPKVRLKAIDGSQSIEFWVNPLGSNQYYFDGYIDTLDKTKEYVFEVESGSPENISAYRKVQGICNKEQDLGNLLREKLTIENNVVSFEPIEYSGDIATQVNILAMEQSEKGYYIKGEIAITEWIGTTWNIPDVLPTINLVALDGSQTYSFWVNPLGSNIYYFDGYISGIDTSKEYIFEVALQNDHNISKYKKQNAYYGKNITLGNYQGEEVRFTQDNHLVFGEKYIGDIATQLNSLALAKNEKGETYLKGKIVVTEWLDGITWSVPNTTPIIRIKDQEGTTAFECWVNPVGGNTYYFDTYIEGIDASRSYVIEVESGNKKNISTYRKTNAYFGKDITLGTYYQYNVAYQQEQIVFKAQTYIGDVATEIKEIEIANNKLTGKIVVTEWIDGITWSVPRDIPTIELIDKEETISKKAKVTQEQETNTYFFTIDLTGLDVEKEYQILVTSSSKENNSSFRKVIGSYSFSGQIGQYQDYVAFMKENSITFEEIQQENEEQQKQEAPTIEAETKQEDLVVPEEEQIEKPTIQEENENTKQENLVLIEKIEEK